MNTFRRRSVATALVPSFALLSSACASWHERNSRLPEPNSHPAHPTQSDSTGAASAGGTTTTDGQTKDASKSKLETLAFGAMTCGALLVASGWKQSHPIGHCDGACEEMKLAGTLQISSGIVLIVAGVLAM